jgi:hypothetical protein
MIPSPEPVFRIHDIKKKFSCIVLFEGIFTSFFNKKLKRSHKTVEIQGFSYYFCVMIEGSGSIYLTNGSGSGPLRPKNMWIRWIRNRIRIRNTARKVLPGLCRAAGRQLWRSAGVAGPGPLSPPADGEATAVPPPHNKHN